ncbi:unnamed protein product [Thelazia callipaeda]|uniref:TLDc domain-containing protein n=1 Tax=Thelazia callipaeda TaxID=103827 RepID=A0A0N5D6F6_THECL|nr:unnamed protein product [Thelazia callipaeda]
MQVLKPAYFNGVLEASTEVWSSRTNMNGFHGHDSDRDFVFFGLMNPSEWRGRNHVSKDGEKCRLEVWSSRTNMSGSHGHDSDRDFVFSGLMNPSEWRGRNLVNEDGKKCRTWKASQHSVIISALFEEGQFCKMIGLAFKQDVVARTKLRGQC